MMLNLKSDNNLELTETKGRSVFDGDIPIVVGGKIERMGTLMISI